MPEQIWLTSEEAAVYTRFKEATLRLWRWRGDGPRYYKRGNKVRYNKADLDEFLTSGEQGGGD